MSAFVVKRLSIHVAQAKLFTTTRAPVDIKEFSPSEKK